MAQLTDERLAELRNRFERAGEPYYYSPLTHLECREVFAEVDRLRARNAELVKVLRGVEWGCPVAWEDTDDRGDHCPRCFWKESDGHAPDCELAAALNSN